MYELVGIPRSSKKKAAGRQKNLVLRSGAALDLLKAVASVHVCTNGGINMWAAALQCGTTCKFIKNLHVCNSYK